MIGFLDTPIVSDETIEQFKQWLDALRSGKYQQGANCLRKAVDGHDEYCCMGVLVDVIYPDGWKEYGEVGVYSVNGMAGYPPKYFLQGVLQAYCVHDSKAIQLRTALSNMNDWENLTFDQIADELESVLDQLISAKEEFA